jgi:hypothetical protein
MHLPTPEPLLDLNHLPAALESFYLHEYVHFLQDVSTTDGLANAAMVGDYLRYAVQHVQQPDPAVPVLLPPTASIAPQQALRKLYLGDSLHDRNKPQPVSRQLADVQEVDAGIVLPDGRRPTRIEVTFATGETFDFGANWLTESMAFIAEQLVYPHAALPAEVAYYAVELLVDYLYPALEQQNRENVLALCDASLLFLQPGQALYRLLRRMQEQQWLPARPEDIYDYANRTLRFNFQGITTASGLLDYTAVQAIELLAGWFTAEVAQPTAIWLQHVMLRAVHLRTEKPYFILDLVRSGPIKTNPVFAHLLRWLGAPLTTNNADEGFSILMADLPAGAAVNFDLFRAVRQLMRLFSSGHRPCEMRPYCQKTCDDQEIPDFTDENCRHSPWNRYTSPHGLCAFAVMWQMWGLNGVVPPLPDAP